MSDNPDYTLPITITAVAIATLPVDIKAQSIGNLAIDIKAQSMGNLSVNLAASAITLNVAIQSSAVTLNVNITSISGGVTFNVAQSGAWTINIGAPLDASGDLKTAIQSSVQLNINIAASAVTLNVAITSSVQLNINIAASGVTLNVAIQSSAVTLDINIASQGAFNLGVDIKAQTIGNISVNIAASAVTLNVAIQSSAVTLNVAIQSSAVTLNVNISSQSAFNLNINIAASAITLNVNLTSSSITLNVNISSQSANLNINIAAQGVNLSVVNAAATHLDIDITAQSVGNVSVNLAASAITLNVSVQGTANINVSSQSAPVNINTSGGTNIIIDKLLQGAYTENRLQPTNQGADATWTSNQGNTRRGKYFPRGCRGFIRNIFIYCHDKGASGGSITYYLSPYIGAGYLYSGTITVEAGGGASNRSVALNKMWNYDSCFFFIVCSSSDIEFGYDTGTPWDAHYSSDSGATWNSNDFRIWLKFDALAATVGDLPVSGIVNNVEIPNSGTISESGTVAVNNAATVTLVTINGSGKLIRAEFWAAHSQTIFYIYADGVKADALDTVAMNGLGYTGTTPAIQLLKYTVEGTCFMQYVVPVEFTRILEIKVYNYSGAARDTYAKAVVNLIK